MTPPFTIQPPAHNFVIRDNNNGLALATLRKRIGVEAFGVFLARSGIAA